MIQIDDDDSWNKTGDPEVPILQEAVNQSEFIRQGIRVQIREHIFIGI